MTNSKIGDLEPRSKEIVSTEQAVRFYKGPMSEERIAVVKSFYEKKGWKHNDKAILLSFVSPCGRWWDCYDRETSQFFHIDGEWVINYGEIKR